MKDGGGGPWWLPVAAAIVGAILALAGGFLARRAEDRRARRAEILISVMPGLLQQARLRQNHDRRVLITSIDSARRSAAVASPWDLRRVKRIAKAWMAYDALPDGRNGFGALILSTEHEEALDEIVNAVEYYDADLAFALSDGVARRLQRTAVTMVHNRKARKAIARKEGAERT